MQVKNGKDFWAGLMFLAFGLGFMLVAIRNYNMGTAVRMGPAYFPTLLGGLMAILGLAIFIRAFASKQLASLKVVSFRPLPFIVGALLCGLAWYLRGPLGTGFIQQTVTLLGLIGLTAAFGPPSLYLILSAVLIFAFLLKPTGLFIASAVLVILSRVKSEKFNLADLPISIVMGFVLLAVFFGLTKLTDLFLPGGWSMFLSTVLALGGSIWIGKRMPNAELGIMFGVLGIFCISVFVFGLGLPFNVCPEVLDDACRNIGLGK